MGIKLDEFIDACNIEDHIETSIGGEECIECGCKDGNHAQECTLYYNGGYGKRELTLEGKMKDKIIGLLRSTERPGIENLIDYMTNESDFFTAPCSTQYHLCKVGGLAEHSLNVYNFMQAVRSDTDILESESSSIVISSLLHDLGKSTYRGKSNYIPNILTNGKISDKKPFETNKDRLSIPHEIASIFITSKYIELTEEEEFAIMYHNGLYVSSGRDIQGKERPLQLLLHFSDMWCSRFVEKDGTE